MSCRCDNACSVSPAMNSSATCRLNAALRERCFVMASILRKPGKGGQLKSLVLSTRRGALPCGNCKVSPKVYKTTMPPCRPRWRWLGATVRLKNRSTGLKRSNARYMAGPTSTCSNTDFYLPPDHRKWPRAKTRKTVSRLTATRHVARLRGGVPASGAGTPRSAAGPAYQPAGTCRRELTRGCRVTCRPSTNTSSRRSTSLCHPGASDP